jgi:hypothetical protein
MVQLKYLLDIVFIWIVEDSAMTMIQFLRLFRARTSSAQNEMLRFMDCYEQYLNRIKSLALTILVWGPSLAADNPIVKKRKDIYRALLEDGHNAILSEDLPRNAGNLSLKSQELAQAYAAHLVIILIEDAQGALGELHDFGADPTIASKLFVLAPMRYYDGYSAKGILSLLEQGYGAVYWYQEEEIEQCHLLTRSLLRAQARREIQAEYMFHRKDA